jgi:hypothetical protein
VGLARSVEAGLPWNIICQDRHQRVCCTWEKSWRRQLQQKLEFENLLFLDLLRRFSSTFPRTELLSVHSLQVKGA